MITHEPEKAVLEKPAWIKTVRQYHTPSHLTSVWQLANTVVPYCVLWFCMAHVLDVSYLLTLLLAIPAALLLTRIIVLQHDCGHTSFFRSRRANEIVGCFCSLLTFMPFHYWRRMHAEHHSHSGDMDHRGIGDYPTLTVKEYLNLSEKQQRAYRMNRHPIMMFIVLPLFGFLVAYRFDYMNRKQWTKERRALVWNNIGMGVLAGALIYAFGWQTYLLVQLPIIALTSMVAAWFFFVQHHHEHAQWVNHEEWDNTVAALHGSSHYQLPKILQWFSASIGLHHIHHLSPKIPNYLLQKCHDENPQLRPAATLTLRSSFRTIGLDLWDEEKQQLVSFRSLTAAQASPAT